MSHKMVPYTYFRLSVLSGKTTESVGYILNGIIILIDRQMVAGLLYVSHKQKGNRTLETKGSISFLNKRITGIEYV